MVPSTLDIVPSTLDKNPDSKSGRLLKTHLLQISLHVMLSRRGNLMIFIANTTMKVTYRKLAIHFSQGKTCSRSCED